jgi:hypothetical protein
MRRGCHFALSSLSIAAVFVAAEARADQPPQVEVAMVGDTEHVAEVGQRIDSWFRAQHVPTRTSAVATFESGTVLTASGQAGVHAWIAVLDGKVARVFFRVESATARPRFLVSEIPLDAGLDELGIERLAQIVYLSAMGLWEGSMESSRREVEQELAKQAGDARAVPPPAPTSLPPPPPPSPQAPSIERDSTVARADGTSPVGVRAGFEYTMRWRGDLGIGQTVGASLGALHRLGDLEVGGLVHAGAILPQASTGSGVELDTQGVTFAVGAAAARRFQRTRLVAEVGFAADVVRYRTGAIADPSLRPEAGATDVQPFTFVCAGAQVDLGPVGIGLVGLLDVALERTHYDVASGGARSRVLVPWIVQPGFGAGASW